MFEKDCREKGSRLQSKIMNRVGIGIDVHRFAANRKLVIGGVEIPHETGLEGHSDADVLAHAVADSLLGAAALGDIGKFYPPSDMKFKDMDSMIIVRECAERVRKAGGRINNVDAMIVAQAPKMAPHIPKMQENLAKNLSVAASQVGIKATTSEHMGFTGREEGIVVVAIASVEI
jgi:2-C-methyl-D-erythritol 2,4-cyclodiphosphate synthase